MGALEVASVFRSRGYQTTTIEWFASWSHEELYEALLLGLKESEEQIIGISVMFNYAIIEHYSDIFRKIRTQYPDVKIILGGVKSYSESFADYVDYVFIGRGREMLETYLDKKDMSKFATLNPSVFINKNVDFLCDPPIVPEMVDDDFLTPQDILSFEIGIGCKFNCSFCSFPLRGAKNPLLADSEKIREFLQTAYDRYGVKNFYIADDTINEDDTKLEILANAVEGLTYKPNLTGYFRADLFERRPHQYGLLQRCNMAAITFGIETLNPEAAKLIKKSTKDVITALEKMKIYSPSTHISSGIIVGLTKDTEESIWNSIEFLISNNLVHALSPYPLVIGRRDTDLKEQDTDSDISKFPEKYGYEIIGVNEEESSRPDCLHILNWKNDWCTYQEASNISDRMNDYLLKNQVPNFSGFRWLILLSLGIVNSNKDFRKGSVKVLTSRLEKLILRHKRNYIGKKLNYLRNNNI